MLTALGGYGLVTVLAAGASLATHSAGTSATDGLIALALATVGAAIADRLPKRTASGVLGVVATSTSLVLLTQARDGGTSWVLAALAGVGAGLAHRGTPRSAAARAALGTGVGVAAVQVALVARVLGADAARLSALAGALALLVVVARPEHCGSARGRLFPAVAVVAASLVTGAWVGANSPSARWFGDIISHGPRDGHLVAITFDDGPDVPYTLRIRDVLDAHGAKATFFTVGRALDARPDVSAALLRDGDVLANHSYRHDERGWLDPRYPELRLTQRAFRDRLGVCPTFFRPPHGQHTPMMAWQVHRAGMRMVGWDVSAGDWATSDAALVAHRVLAHVRGGSIIDLHDGLDGTVTADRSVLLKALPVILDGLAARGLRPVTLDRLLGTSPYAGHCS